MTITSHIRNKNIVSSASLKTKTLFKATNRKGSSPQDCSYDILLIKSQVGQLLDVEYPIQNDPASWKSHSKNGWLKAFYLPTRYRKENWATSARSRLINSDRPDYFTVKKQPSVTYSSSYGHGNHREKRGWFRTFAGVDQTERINALRSSTDEMELGNFPGDSLNAKALRHSLFALNMEKMVWIFTIVY
ncbi:hypothetical protein AVEN_125458-1 [Araneus ventricosus]|uniref:Uncharacterized protein n=1 Tax=Araneus ventricosus TaxID=182803 RepID=A0A4Y2H7A9_ARAVE|nr:hypothetical protein AVEN_125458-1 [Araneus ventricosus]